MPVDIQLPGAAGSFTIATDGDAAFVAAEIRKTAAQGDGWVVLLLDDGGLLVLNPAASWFRLRSVPAPRGDPDPLDHRDS